MTTKKLLIASCILLPALAFGKNIYGLSEAEPEAQKQIKLVNDFRIMPYKEDLQKEILEKFGTEIDYVKNVNLFNTLKLLYINTTNKKYKEEAQYKLSKYITSDKKTKEKKKNKLYERTRAHSENSAIQALYLESQGMTDKVQEFFQETGFKKKLSLVETFYQLKYFTSVGDYDQARKIFSERLDDKYLKSKRYINRIKIKKGYELITTKIYALAAIFEPPEKKERIINILKNLENGSTLYMYYGYKHSLKTERYGDATVFMEELRRIHPSLELSLESLELYKQDSFRKLVNEDNNGAWISARKGLNIIEYEKNLGDIKTVGISLKKSLLKSSARLVYELSERGEYSQSKRVQKETSRLMAIKLF